MSLHVELKGSAAGAAGFVGWEVKGSGSAAVAEAGSLRLAANRSGSGASAVFPNGSVEPQKGSSEERWLLAVCVKKLSVAKGSDPLKGSPPNGSGGEKTKQNIKFSGI